MSRFLNHWSRAGLPVCLAADITLNARTSRLTHLDLACVVRGYFVFELVRRAVRAFNAICMYREICQKVEVRQLVRRTDSSSNSRMQHVTTDSFSSSRTLLMSCSLLCSSSCSSSADDGRHMVIIGLTYACAVAS